MGESTTRAGDASPDENTESDEFPRPPGTFTDGDDRSIAVRGLTDGDRSALIDFYDSFDSADRAQGLPPRTTADIESWLADICDEGVHTVGCHGERAVGHACLVPTRDARHELAIFIASSYQHAGIGTRLLRYLFGRAKARGVERVWLVVSPRNTVARRLYESAGFARTGEETTLSATDVQMERRL